jgi:HPr kinase/phosphorylase
LLLVCRFDLGSAGAKLLQMKSTSELVTQTPGRETVIHGNCVAVQSAAVLIIGASGSGKSALALQLMAMGGELVADDRVHVRRREGILVASCPSAISGKIEARGVGILAVNPRQYCIVRLVVDLNSQEDQRLPPLRKYTLLGLDIDLLHGSKLAHFPAAVCQYLKGGRLA